MRATLEFNLEETHERNAFRRASNADAAYGALWDIAQEVFRPARKHGYADAQLDFLREENTTNERIVETIGILEEKFYSILQEQGVSLGDYE